VAEAQRAYDEVQAATKAGDWARVAEAQQRLGEALQRMAH
jgi:hypothetical protein